MAPFFCLDTFLQNVSCSSCLWPAEGDIILIWGEKTNVKGIFSLFMVFIAETYQHGIKNWHFFVWGADIQENRTPQTASFTSPRRCNHIDEAWFGSICLFSFAYFFLNVVHRWSLNGTLGRAGTAGVSWPLIQFTVNSQKQENRQQICSRAYCHNIHPHMYEHSPMHDMSSPICHFSLIKKQKRDIKMAW